MQATIEKPATATVKSKPLDQRAMLVSLTIRSWSARKQDKRVTREVAEREKASGADVGRYHKQLLPKEALAFMAAKAGAARKEHYTRTLPWADEGSRILPAEAYLDYTRVLRELKRDFEAAADDFVRNYDQFVSDAKLTLGGLYNETDYPKSDHIRRKFGMEMHVLPLPTANDFRVDMSGVDVDAIREDIRSQVHSGIVNAQRDVFERMAKVAEAITSKLANYTPPSRETKAQGIFRDSLITNVRELVSIVPTLNLSGNEDIDKLCARLHSLSQVEPDTLRNDANARATTARDAQAILDKVNDFLA